MHKFDMRACRCNFFCYPLGQKGYCVYDLDTKKIFTFRDVFHEHIFLFSISPLESQFDYPVLPMPLDEVTTFTSLAMVNSLDYISSLSQVKPPLSMESSIPIESTQISPQHQPPFYRSTQSTKTSTHLRDYQVNHALLLDQGAITPSTSSI